MMFTVIFYGTLNKAYYNYKIYVLFAGVPHGEDIFYIFGYPIIGHFRSQYDQRDKEMSQMVMTMWGNFVKYG